MKTVLFFLYILGTAVAIPTNARFLSNHPQPTADSLSFIQQTEMLVTADDTTVPILRAEENGKETTVYEEDHPNHKAEKTLILKSKKENHEQSADQDQSYSPELGLQDQEKSESDLSENLEYTPTEGALDLKEDMSKPQEKKFPENTDFLVHDVSSLVHSNQQESITKTEKSQEQLINDSHPQLNRSSKHGQDLSDQGNQEQDPISPNGEEEGEKQQGEVGTRNDNQKGEREVPREHSNSKQEDDSTQSDDILKESNQPTQVSKMQKDESKQGHQEQEEDNSKEEMEESTEVEINKHNPDTEWQNQQGKPGLEIISNPEEMEKKTFSETLLVGPTDDGDDGSRLHARDDYLTQSEAFQEGERAASKHYFNKYKEQREKAHENENVGTSEPGEYQGMRLFTMRLI